jgi:hypothetical protein
MVASTTSSPTNSHKPLNIALLGYRSNPYSGGQGVYLKHLAKALVDMGHRVDVISGEPYPELDARVDLVKLPGLNLYAHPNPAWPLTQQRWRDPLNVFEWASYWSGGFPEPFTFGHRLLRHFKTDAPSLRHHS